MKYAKMILYRLPVFPNPSTFPMPDFVFENLQPFRDFLCTKPNTGWIKKLGRFPMEGNKLELEDQDHSLKFYYDPDMPIQFVCIDDKIYTFTVKSTGTNFSLMWCYHMATLDQIFRDDSDDPILDDGEVAVRQSFHALLDFFGKLGYLLHLDLIKKEELLYFQYYLYETIKGYPTPDIINMKGYLSPDIAFQDSDISENPVISYCRNYRLMLFVLLLKEIDLFPDSLEDLVPMLKTL